MGSDHLPAMKTTRQPRTKLSPRPSASDVTSEAAAKHRAEGLADIGDQESLNEDSLGNVPLPPEIMSPDLEEITAWDEAATDSGHRITPVTSEDETQAAMTLVEEGMDEADEELRALDEDVEKDLEDEERERV